MNVPSHSCKAMTITALSFVVFAKLYPTLCAVDPATGSGQAVGIRPAKLGLYYAQAVSHFNGEAKSRPLAVTSSIIRHI